MNIYTTTNNYKQFTIDCLEPRKKCAKYKQYYHQAHKTTGASAKHIAGADWYAKSKALTTHNLKPNAQREQVSAYVLLNDGGINTLLKYERMLKHEHINYIVYAQHEIVKGKEKLVNYISSKLGTYRVYRTTRSNMIKLASELVEE